MRPGGVRKRPDKLENMLEVKLPDGSVLEYTRRVRPIDIGADIGPGLARATLAAECFRDLDDALKDLLDYARRNEAITIIMSDHGHGPLEGKAQPNLLLKRWGYLQLVGRW